MDPEKQPPSPSPIRRKRITARQLLTRLFCFLIVIYALRYITIAPKHGSTTFRWSGTEKERYLTTKEKEDLFLSIPNTGSATATAKLFSKHPHLAGSQQDYTDALSMLEFFQEELGIASPHEQPISNAGTPKSRARTIALTSRLGPRKPTAWVDVYYPLLDTPLDRSLDIVDDAGNSLWSADLREDGNAGDEDAAKYRDFIPAWLGLSGHGEGQGQLVYVNYGSYEDYEEVLATGQNLTGKIVIARYGGLFRGLKVKRAEELGAAAILIYSDTRDDGFVTVENDFAPYPDGPARNPTSVQRGSSMYLSNYPGDPTTPGWPAYDKAQRQDPTSIPGIPSLPISWANAQKLLEEIGDVYAGCGPDGQRKLSGKASTRDVKVVSHVDRKITPIWNTMAAIPGHVRDEVVIIGCHRDAWVLGAADPVSGTVSLSEVVRGLGALLREGWKPLRTILIASWDAEEYGLIGSTEYGEDFADWISEHAVAYLNVDVSSSGSLWGAIASPSLSHLIRRTAMDVPHPSGEQGKTLWDARKDEGPFKPFGPVEPNGELGVVALSNTQGVNNTVSPHRVVQIGKLRADADVMEAYETARKGRLIEKDGRNGTGVEPMGSGSDFTVFLQRLGVASSDQSFVTTPYDAPYHYHSIYDSMRWQEVYTDPGFKKHLAIAQHMGLLLLRLTDSIIIPLNTTQYTLELDGYLDEVEALLPSPNVQDETSLALTEFSNLRQSISQLQEASILLDIEKADAEEHFKELLSKMPSFPGNAHGSCKKQSPLSRRLKTWIKGIFGVDHQKHKEAFMIQSWESLLSGSESGEDEDRSIAGWLEHRLSRSIPDLPDIPNPPDIPDFPDIPNIPNVPDIPHPPSRPDSISPLSLVSNMTSSSPFPPIFEFIRAAKRVSRANRKLISFERGFIDAGGIKDREWYRHLVVAPGKWLGYGATTMPAITEAITIEKNTAAAMVESERLAQLLDAMSENLQV
ncbi:hypothetical protein BDP27DRAFT_1421735 [Rhodocollybia butyracea]|uniref:Zn-dependent exopeptidase n=1 Tax=Rhodocollybia butyracea TaxID=206335 RepID=A0A9P5PSD9_9AGAR|nr:hypothetical protein BDP27DRAFT_1421735 [Rhodocollybia butyracea]